LPAHEIIIDDPVQPEDALSERVKQQLRDWVNSSVYTRFNDPSQGAMVLVMHRLAPDDLGGVALQQDFAAHAMQFGFERPVQNPDPSRVKIVEGDVLDAGALRDAMRGQDVVYANLV